MELFIESGYEAATMEAIAARAAVSRRTAFNHFPAKSSITVEWTRRRRERAADRMARGGQATVTTGLRAYYHELAVLTAETPLETEAMLWGWLTVGGPVRQNPLPQAVGAWLETTCSNGAFRTSPTRVAEILSDVYQGALWRWLGDDRATDIVAEIDSVIGLSLVGLSRDVAGGATCVDRVVPGAPYFA